MLPKFDCRYKEFIVLCDEFIILTRVKVWLENIVHYRLHRLLRLNTGRTNRKLR
jgi:hypothetical protein